MGEPRRISTYVWISVFVVCVAGLVGVDSEPTTRELLNRIEALEKQAADQRHRTERQDETLQELRLVIQKQNENNRDQETRIVNLQTKVKEQEHIISKLVQQTARNNAAAAASAATVDTENANKDDSIADQTGGVDVAKKGQANAETEELFRQSRLLMSNGPVAFLVRLDHGVTHMGENQNVRFDTVITNIGGGYHQSHGLFITPASGIYIFSTSMFSKENAYIIVDIEKNGVKLGGVYANSYSANSHDQGSVTVVTQLEVGDEVWVKVISPATNAAVSEGYTSFMGCLIMPVEA